MVEMLNKLEFMLMGLRQMQISAVCAWFPYEKKENIIKAIQESHKFKIEGNIVSLKSETERYEEELQKDILKELIGEEEVEVDDDLSGYDDEDLELVEEIKKTDDDFIIIEQSTSPNMKVDTSNILVEDAVESTWIDAQNLADELTPSKFEEVITPEAINEEVVQASVVEEDMQKDEEVKVAYQKTSGADLTYEELLKVIDEYNEKIEAQIDYASENNIEVKVKAIKTFYQNKYNVKLKEENILDGSTSVYALINRKKGVEAAYLLITETLTNEILTYMMDSYDDEVVYFCPINGSQVEFEVGLNEFYLKDTDVIFAKYLEHYVVTAEKEYTIKKLEVIVGNK